MRLTWFGFYCGLMLSISAFSIDILLPSLLGMSRGLSTSVEAVQLVIPVYMIALGFGNPVFGLLSDRIGRRSGIFIGLTIYIFGSCVCTFATTIEVLLSGRFLQGFGAACAPVICRAMIRDRFEGVELAKTMAIASMFFALGPMLAPLLGYVLYATAGWRAVFFILIVLSALMLTATFYQPETLPISKRRKPGMTAVLADINAVFRHPQSRAYIALSCISTGIILLFLAHAPLIYNSFGAGPGRFSVMFALTSVGIVLGQLSNHRLLSVLTPASLAYYAAIVVAITAVVVYVAAITGTLNEYFFTAIMFVFSTSYLLVFSNLISLILEPHGERAGMASAMFGFCSYVGGSILVTILTFVTNQSTSRWALCFTLISCSLLAGLYYANRRLNLAGAVSTNSEPPLL